MSKKIAFALDQNLVKNA